MVLRHLRNRLDVTVLIANEIMWDASLNERTKRIHAGFSWIIKGYESTARVILHPIQGVGVILLVDVFAASKIPLELGVRLVGRVSDVILSGCVFREQGSRQTMESKAHVG